MGNGSSGIEMTPPSEHVLTRRTALTAAIGALLPASISRAAPPTFPAKNIQFIIPYAAGGGFDAYVRFISPVMEQYLQARASIVPVNIAAASGSRGISQLFRAKADGYTIGILDLPGMFIEQALQGNTAYDLSKFSWIGCMGEGEHYLLAVGASSPIKTFADLKALSAKRPVKFSSTGIEGTATAATIIGTEMLGIRRQLITGYRGSSDYIVAAIRGDSDAVVSATSTMMKFARAGQLRIIASFATHSAIAGIPDATTLGKPELDEITVERPVAAPPGTPPAIQNILSDALARALKDAKVVAWARDNDVVMNPKTPQQTEALVARERAFFERWKTYLKL
jgi:tripartite-type tricarboxylate transporter receptor subunit TctC